MLEKRLGRALRAGQEVLYTLYVRTRTVLKLRRRAKSLNSPSVFSA